jgi:MFS transporter, DHA3 family, macrolide efflux protein
MITYTPNRWWLTTALLWVTQTIVLISGNALNFALIWQLAGLTASAQSVLWAAALTLVPSVIVAPFAGVLSDRLSRRRVLMIAEGLALLSLVGLWGAERVTNTWLLYAVLVWRATATVFYQTAFQATLPQLIPAQHYQRLSGMQQMVMGISSLLTPVLGALIVEEYGLSWAVSMTAVVLLLSMGMLLILELPQPLGTIVTRWQDDVRDMRHIYGQRRGLWQLLLAAVVLNMCVLPVFSLLPYLVSVYFATGAWLLAWLEISGGAGLVIGAVLLAVWGGFGRAVHTMLAAVALLIVALLWLALVPATAPLWILGAVLLIGWSAAWAHGPLLTMVQRTIPSTMHGRAMALLNASMNIAAPVGLVVAGAVVERISHQGWALGVIVCILLLVVWVLRSDVMKLEDS